MHRAVRDLSNLPAETMFLPPERAGYLIRTVQGLRAIAEKRWLRAEEQVSIPVALSAVMDAHASADDSGGIGNAPSSALVGSDIAALYPCGGDIG